MDLIYLHAMENPSKYQTLCEFIEQTVNSIFSRSIYHITELIETCRQLNKTRMIVELMFHSTNEIIKWNISHGDDLLSIEQLFDHYIILHLQRLTVVQQYNLSQIDELFSHLNELSNYILHCLDIISLLNNITDGYEVIDAVKMICYWSIYEKESYLTYLKLDVCWYIDHGYHKENYRYARLILSSPEEVMTRIIEKYKRLMSFNQLCDAVDGCYITEQITDDMLSDRIDEPMVEVLIAQRSGISNYKDHLQIKLLTWNINEKAERTIVSHISDSECSVLLNEYSKKIEAIYQGISFHLVCYNISLWGDMITSYKNSEVMNSDFLIKMINKPNVQMTYLGKVIITDHLNNQQISCSHDIAIILLLFNEHHRISGQMIENCLHQDVYHKTIDKMMNHGWIIKQDDCYVLSEHISGSCYTNLKKDKTSTNKQDSDTVSDESKKCQIVRTMKKFSTKWFTIQQISSMIGEDVSKLMNNLVDICLVQEQNGKYKYLP